MIYISFDIGFKNLAMCILELNHSEEAISIVDWRVITLADTKKELKSIEELSERIFMELDNVIGTLKSVSIEYIDFVLIENQPSNLNGIMKTIQHIIYTYFSLLKYWDNNIGQVQFINASLKLKNHEHTSDIQLETNCKRNSKGFTREKYKWNKACSIEICKKYIENDRSLLDYFEQNRKKDDLSDSLLQAISYIRSHKSHATLSNNVKLNSTHMLECVN